MYYIFKIGILDHYNAKYYVKILQDFIDEKCLTDASWNDFVNNIVANTSNGSIPWMMHLFVVLLFVLFCFICFTGGKMLNSF